MAQDRPRYVIAPGYLDSDPGHWQSLWAADFGLDATRVVTGSWDAPELEDWVTSLDAAMSPGAVIVAHSLGCLAATTWLERHPGVAAGAFLVALPDPEGAEFPAVITGFSRPRRALAGPVLMVGSSDDPYAGVQFTRDTAATVGARLVEIGAAGHISTASGRGPWPEGRRLLAEFVVGLGLQG
ncbi:MAG: serine hydrolase family protein [Propionibacteriaceae bacterium]|nr:serine hydrolase family protein [Propionibacteriaceae bacterium]